MGNTRRFNPSRRAKVLGLKEQNHRLIQQVGYLEGIAAARTAQLAAAQMERPPDLDEWVATAITDLDEAELAEWNAMTPEAQDEFVTQLGVRINESKATLDGVEEVVQAQEQTEH